VREAAAIAIPDDLVGNRIKAVVQRTKTQELKIVELPAVLRDAQFRST